MQKFTPRKDGSKWSGLNKERVERLIKQKRMTRAGMKKVEAAKQSGRWDRPVSRVEIELPAEFKQALKKNRRAKDYFDTLAPSYRRQYAGWIGSAVKQATREKRIEEALRRLARGEKLGMK
jgi:uncharacterized protein YdeI (YjbR/CyaY-like superfamily)